MKLIGAPRPGVCDLCGHAVVRSHLHPPKSGWQNGHWYRKFKLRKVLCEAHGGIFPREAWVPDVIIGTVGPMILESHRRHALPEFPALRFIGFWRSDTEYTLPDAANYVDEAWDPVERARVVAHLRAAPEVEYWKGSSICRLCNLHPLGSTDQCDGTYLWPAGFAHYVEKHAVRPPEEFLAHVRKNPMTSFCPLVPQSFDALKAAAPPGLELLRVDWYGELLWLGIPGRAGTGLAARAMSGPGVELIRYGDEPNAVLQALADFWGCAVVCRHNELERFDPTPSRV